MATAKNAIGTSDADEAREDADELADGDDELTPMTAKNRRPVLLRSRALAFGVVDVLIRRRCAWSRRR